MKIVTKAMVLSAVMLTFFNTHHAFAASVSQKAVKDEFFEDFSDDSLDLDRWLIAEKMWGGFNGGVVPENVSVSDGVLRLEGHGNRYTGSVQGLNPKLPGGIRTGAAIATKAYYASGSYEVRAKVAPVLGACSAIWTFQYEEHMKGSEEYKKYPDQTGAYAAVNHEIDIELPTANQDFKTPSFGAARFNTYQMENRYNPHFQTLPKAVDDGEWHDYRFDWHTGDTDEEARVEFYVDGELLYTSFERIPTNASRLWLGLWFPASVDSDKDGFGDTGWTGTADFDVAAFEIDSVMITPFNEAGDTVGNETYGFDGWAEDSFTEIFESEKFEHVKNGDFSNGTDNWNVSGEAFVHDQKAVFKAGSITKTLSQKIAVQPKTTYTLRADIWSDGTKVRIGARKANGTQDVFKIVEATGRNYVTFTTGAGCKEMTIYAEAERYQPESLAYIDNISVVSGAPDVDPDFVLEEMDLSLNEQEPEIDTPEISTPEISEETETEDVKLGSDWIISGSASADGDEFILSSGSDTDRVSQQLKIKKGGTYTVSAEIDTDGAVLDLGVDDYNGRYTNLKKSISKDGKYELTFTAANHIDTVVLYFEVLRYQENSKPVHVANVQFAEGNGSGDVITEDMSEPEEKPDNGEENNGEERKVVLGEWELSGSAIEEDNAFILQSGADTDRIVQRITVKKGGTYRLSCEVESDGAELELGVNDYDGRYTNVKTATSEKGKAELEFTVAKHIDIIELYGQVVRYQDNDTPVLVRNIRLTELQ